MTRTDKLLQLAEAAGNEPAPYVRAQAVHDFRYALNPATAKELLLLMRQMAGAMSEAWEDGYNYVGVEGFIEAQKAFDDALAAYEQWENAE